MMKKSLIMILILLLTVTTNADTLYKGRYDCPYSIEEGNYLFTNLGDCPSKIQVFANEKWRMWLIDDEYNVNPEEHYCLYVSEVEASQSVHIPIQEENVVVLYGEFDVQKINNTIQDTVD